MAENYGYAYVRYRGKQAVSKVDGYYIFPGDVFIAKITDPHDGRDFYTVEVPHGVSWQMTFLYADDVKMWSDWELL